MDSGERNMRAKWGRTIWAIMLAGMMAEATARAGNTPYPANGEAHDVLAANNGDVPLSKDDLFGTGPVSGADAAPVVNTESARPTSKDDLFGTGADSGLTEKAAPASKDALFNPEQAS